MPVAIEMDRDRLADACVRHGVRTLKVFGASVAGDFDPEHSDVDFLVTFHEVADLAEAYFGLKSELEEIVDRSVDLVFEDHIRNPYFLATVMAGSLDLYAA
ncbi:nucleotidyltransferase family protein [Populibacterium corticicola]|uniref:Nucleotidyltransferase family protein n=1 Tax=Populibacterium corticicola TaxID=1812826 RepID=A0ABW5XGA1_9MICO